MLSYFIHVHKVFISIARSIEIYSKKWQSYCHQFTIVDKNGLFNFFRQKKKKNEASWSEINRNGLHSLKESSDLEDNSITV